MLIRKVSRSLLFSAKKMVVNKFTHKSKIILDIGYLFYFLFGIQQPATGFFPKYSVK